MAGTQDNSTLLQLQKEASDRMLSALQEVFRQESEARDRVDEKKERLRKLRQQRASGQVENSSQLDQKQLQLDELRREIHLMRLDLKYKEDRGQLYYKVEVGDVPPPIPERRYRTTTQHYRKPVKEVGPDQCRNTKYVKVICLLVCF